MSDKVYLYRRSWRQLAGDDSETHGRVLRETRVPEADPKGKTRTKNQKTLDPTGSFFWLTDWTQDAILEAKLNKRSER